MVLTLYSSNGSPPCRSVLMLIHKLNLPDVKQVSIDCVKREQYQESFLKINPQHTIPTLKDDDFVIWDRRLVHYWSTEANETAWNAVTKFLIKGRHCHQITHAIAIYLNTLYGKDNPLYPNDPKKRAIINQRLFFDTERLLPSLKILFPVLYQGEKTFRKEFLTDITVAYDLAEKFLTKPYFAGDQITLADICCVSSLSTMDIVIPIDENVYPKLWSWLDRMSKEEFYKQGNEPGLNVLKQYLQMCMS